MFAWSLRMLNTHKLTLWSKGPRVSEHGTEVNALVIDEVVVNWIIRAVHQVLLGGGKHM
jgi:hypothetical protein